MSDSGWVWLFVAGMVLLVAVLIGGKYWLDSCSCDQLGEMTGKETKWRVLSGCYVKVDGRWIPRDSWRGEQER